MKAVITVIGKDIVGILAEVTGKCAKCHVNIIEVTQSVLQDIFAMIMLVDIQNMTIKFSEFSDDMKKLGEKQGLTIHVMHEDIFSTMHRI